ncbi:MAG: peptidoglycan-associated lipoprotein [Rickettsiales bacterium]|jgi:peptidoglycan-associated lipoprotein
MLNKTLTLAVLALAVVSCSSTKNNVADNSVDKAKSQAQEVAKEDSKMFSIPSSDLENATIPQVVYFDTDSSKLTKNSIETLSEKVLMEAKKSNTKKIIIEAHADERGSLAYNQKLSERRASSVKNYLIANGVSSVKIKTIGYGELKPAAFGNNEAAWSKNRRAVTVSIKR